MITSRLIQSRRTRAALVGAVPAVAFIAVLLARYTAGTPVATRSAQTPTPSLLLTAAPQDGEVFLTWSPLPDATYVVRWRVAGASDWRLVQAGAVARHAVSRLRNGVAHEFQVEAHQRDAPLRVSPVVAASAHARPDCVTEDYTPGLPRSHFFCTKRALDDYLEKRGIDPLSLRCREQRISAWPTDVPDCHYVSPSGEHLLLLRSADNVFAETGSYPSPHFVREHARRAIWPERDPFNLSPRAAWPLMPLQYPVVGKVTRHASARSAEITSSIGLTSVVTWFTPPRPVEGRYAIYHEGHGGAAVEIGAETIDWLLQRGWQVVAIDMPLIGANTAAVRPGLQAHADFQSLDDGIVSPLEHFLLPVKSVVDAMLEEAPRSQRNLLLIGRSGGGWTAYVYAALDPRIDFVVSIAGGRPLSARLDAPWGAAELGDYEQTAPHLYNTTGHEHLMLAAGTKGALYIFNRWDACCFRVERDDAFVRYLRKGTQAAGKPITVFVDEEHPGHSMGPRAYQALGYFLSRMVKR